MSLEEGTVSFLAKFSIALIRRNFYVSFTETTQLKKKLYLVIFFPGTVVSYDAIVLSFEKALSFCQGKIYITSLQGFVWPGSHSGVIYSISNTGSSLLMRWSLRKKI